LEDAQASVLATKRDELDASLPTKYKPSAKLLNNKNVFDRLVSSQKFTEAHNLRAEIEEMQVVEQERFNEVREQKITKAIG